MKTGLKERSTCNTRFILTLTSDAALWMIVFSPMIIIHSAGIQPFTRGFFCDDDSLTYPYKPFDEDIVTLKMLLLVTLPLPVLIISLTEIKVFRERQSKQVNQDGGVIRCRPLFSNLYKYVGVYIFGYTCTMSVTTIVKHYMGRLRPNFFSVCKPNMTGINCTDLSGFHRYILDDVCTGNHHDVMQARMSHPSGHSSSAMFAAVFITVYVQIRVFSKLCRLFKSVIQITFLILGVMCCLSRVIDYKHHVTDVLAGGILGSFVAMIAMVRVSSAMRAGALLNRASSMFRLTPVTRCSDVENTNEYRPVHSDDSSGKDF